MRCFFWLTFILLSLPVSSFAISKSILVFAVSQENPTSVKLQQKADFVSMAITITSEQKEQSQQVSEIRQARQVIIEEAKKNNQIKIYTGPSVLAGEGSSSYISKSYSPSSQSEIILLFSLKEGEDVFHGASEINNFMNKIKAPGKSNYRLSPIRLAVENPEKYRSQVIKLVNDDISFLKESIKNTGKIVVGGLESPVQVRQVDDLHIELFIRYNVSIETK